MHVTKEEAYQNIKKLVQRFSGFVEDYKRNGFNELKTREEYINPFFEAQSAASIL